MKSRARLTPYLRGVIFGLFLAGSTYEEIAEEVVKADGCHPCQQTVAACIVRCQKNGGVAWDGGATNEQTSVGRPRTSSKPLDRKIVSLVFKKRGSAIVTVRYIKKTIKEARQLSSRTVARRLNEAGLAWLRRRRKTLVPEAHKAARVQFANWVLRRTVATLARWAYADGTAFYLARSSTEKESGLRSALGPHLWRMANGSDGLCEDCVGPSSYAKAQGTAVRVWGLLVAGFLYIYVLPKGQVMNRWWYEWLILKKFPRWIGQQLGNGVRAYLVQDHERALWAPEPRRAMTDVNIQLLTSYPKCSQDLNPIESAWRELKNRLAATEPAERETRAEFLVRLRNAAAWVNKNRTDYLKKICMDQKVRAKAVLAAKPPGARTQH